MRTCEHKCAGQRSTSGTGPHLPCLRQPLVFLEATCLGVSGAFPILASHLIPRTVGLEMHAARPAFTWLLGIPILVPRLAGLYTEPRLQSLGMS